MGRQTTEQFSNWLRTSDKYGALRDLTSDTIWPCLLTVPSCWHANTCGHTVSEPCFGRVEFRLISIGPLNHSFRLSMSLWRIEQSDGDTIFHHILVSCHICTFRNLRWQIINGQNKTCEKLSHKTCMATLSTFALTPWKSQIYARYPVSEPLSAVRGQWYWWLITVKFTTFLESIEVSNAFYTGCSKKNVLISSGHIL